MASIEIKDPRFEKPITYFMEDWLKKRFDQKVIPDLEKKDKDCIIAIDGGEGTGKSWLAMQLGKYVDPSLDLSRIVFTPDEFREAVYRADKRQCIIYDEAFTGFSSRSSLSNINRTLVSLMMQVRQKNLFIIIVLPTVFLLDKYIALFRTRVLIHVYENKGRRGFFRIYSKKKKAELVLSKGAKTYSYLIRSKKKGRFYGVFALGFQKEEEDYRNKKLKSLESSESAPMESKAVKFRDQRDITIYIIRKELKYSYRKIEEILKGYGFDLSYNQIREICKKFGDKPKDNEPEEAPEGI